MHRLRPLSAVALAAALVTVSPLAAAAEAYLISPQDGETVSSPFVVRFGLKGMGVAPAGIDMPGTGHHHLIIDAPLPPAGQPVPFDDQHKHFGKGQTETELSLPPGEHTLQLILG
ncbi:MAG: DUF4399 domain-containing protein, partial [Betaproteobacteria bacterium]|nr:DUF4399 domain-containing protein [Betaproteobacteria bacterium]